LPKAYQISQYELPVCLKGHLEIETENGSKIIGITRAHLEEDAGKLVHNGDITTTAFSLVDLNRSGIPLLEIVSEPDLRTAQEARAYLEKLRSILLFIGVSDCKMQEGSLRCDANVSVRPSGEKEFGIRTEIKNLNSFKALEKAIAYEARRHMEAIEDGETIVQETRTWDEEKQITRSMRSKEDAHDYRYFPEPDLLPLIIDKSWIEEIKREMPELPDQAQARLMEQYGLSAYNAVFITSTPEHLRFFDECLASFKDAKTISNWMMGDLSRLLNQENMEIEQCLATPSRLASMLNLQEQGIISGKMAKAIFEEIFHTGKEPETIIKEKGLEQISSENDLLPLIQEIVTNNPKVAEDYKNGKSKATGFFVGQVMKATKGQANPAAVNKLLAQVLEKLA
jgi:aspartyl-tRNA(Asn)/glutamyl-tRNA(Gln) amidotransferase subunit B